MNENIKKILTDWVNIVILIIMLLSIFAYVIIQNEFQDNNCLKRSWLCWGYEPLPLDTFEFNMSEYLKEKENGGS